jgi:CRISPR/Cas system CSM-associated protein Csm3 (group 7 of RAMP superfamily)
MKTEFHAEFAMLNANEVSVRCADTTLDPVVRCQLLAGVRETALHELARGAYQGLTLGAEYRIRVIERNHAMADTLGIESPSPDVVGALPRRSWLLSILFTLSKPWISRDDADFHILDNPVRKDKLFQLPTIPASAWKGTVRAAAIFRFLQPVKSGKMNREQLFGRRARLVRLFGNEPERIAEYLNDAMSQCLGTPAGEIGREFDAYLKDLGCIRGDVEGRRGLLFFYPSMLPGLGIEVINPHSRDKRVGRNPILIESVPAGTRGRFHLLSFPFDSIGRTGLDPDQEAAQDLRTALLAVGLVLKIQGFGAKTSSGFGVATVQEAGLATSRDGVRLFREQGTESIEAMADRAGRIFRSEDAV